jgi:hypothetical protein
MAYPEGCAEHTAGKRISPGDEASVAWKLMIIALRRTHKDEELSHLSS